MTTSNTEQQLLLESRYEPVRTLRSGDGVRTVVARDLQTGTEVVLKTARMPLVSPAERDRIAAQAQRGPAMDSPALAPLLHWGVDGETLFTVTPRVQGVPLDVRLLRGELPIADALRTACTVLEGLAILHQHGIRHLNVRPSKIILRSGPGTGAAVLLPVGLSRTSRLQQLGHDQPHDQLRFASPEHIGLIERDIADRADLYSVGALIYTCLTGRPPFDAHTVVELLERQAISPAPPMGRLRRDAPAGVCEFVDRLLRKDPEDRYQTTTAALTDLQALADAFTDDAPSPVLGRHDRRSTLTEPSLVGRSGELDRLTALLDALPHGGGGVLIQGDSGSGKSRLLAELTEEARQREFVVFDSSCLEPGQRRPLSAFAGIAEQVVAHAADRPDWATRFRHRLADGGGPLATVLPDLADLLGRPVEEVSPPAEFGRDRTLRALAALLSALGTAEVPALVVVDDAHWADSLTLEALAEWQTSADGCAVLLVVATRAAGQPHAVRQLARSATQRVAVSRLAAADVRALVESSAGPVPAQALDVIEDWAGGNPFMVTAALRGLVEASALVPGPDGWHMDVARMNAARVGSNAASMLSGRLSRLSPETRQVLSAGAVLGTRFDLRTAARLVGRPTAEAGRLADAAAEATLVFACGLEEYSFVHHRIREEVLQQLTDEELCELHGRVAGDLESRLPSRAFELAHHYDAAGNHLRAVEFALPAAREARRQYTFDLAEELYRIAAHGGDDLPGGQRYEVAAELGEVLKLRGRYEEAIASITLARSLSDSEDAIARSEAELGELAVKQGRSDDARDHLETAIRCRGGRVPRRPLAQAAGLCWQLLLRALHKAGVRLPGHRRRVELSTLAQLYHRLLYPFWFNQSALLSLWTDLRQLNLADRGADQLGLGRAYAVHAALVSGIVPALSGRCLKSIDRATAIQERLNDGWGQAQSLKYRGAVLYSAGRFAESEVCMRETLRLLGRMGDLWEGNLARWYQSLAHYRRGDIATASDTAEKTYHSALDIGDRQAAAISLATWAKASGGRIPRELLPPATGLSGDVYTKVSLLHARAMVAIADEDLSLATETLEQARRLVVRARLFNIFTAPTFAWLATARRMGAEAIPSMAARRRASLLRGAGRAAVFAVCVAVLYRHDMPHALREAGLVAALRGRTRTAHRLLRASLVSARLRDAAVEAELSSSALALLAEPDRCTSPFRPFGSATAPATTPDVPGEAAPEKASRIADLQRHSALLHSGRVLTAAGSQTDLSRSLCDAAVVLLRAERCTLLNAGDTATSDSTVANLDMTEPGPADRIHLERAVALGQPIAIRADDEDVHATNVRSAIYAPISVGEKTVACLRAVHTSVIGMFGEDERQLASFVAALAGTALERIALQDELLSSVIAAQESERARVSRDLHDEIGQGLTSLLLGLSRVEADRAGATGPSTHIHELRSIITDLITQVRRLAFDLRPTILDDLGLSAALRRLADDVSARHQIIVDIDTEPLAAFGRLPPKLESTIYRVAQEALTNVVRHSGAAECSVFVGREGQHLRLIVEDDGAGFEPARIGTDSLGLRGMRERASLVGGSMRVTSRPSAGTSVVLEVPLG